MNKRTGAVVCAATVLAGAGVILWASPASATEPTVMGTGTCNTGTGFYDVVWTVTGEIGEAYKETEGVFTSASRVPEQIVGVEVQGAGSVTAVETVADASPISLTVSALFSNGHEGSATGAAVFNTPECAIPEPQPTPVPPVEPPAPPTGIDVPVFVETPPVAATVPPAVSDEPVGVLAETGPVTGWLIPVAGSLLAVGAALIGVRRINA